MYSSVSLFLPLVFKQWKNLSIREVWGKNPFADTQIYLMGSSHWERVRFWDFFLLSELKGTKLECQQKSSVLKNGFCTQVLLP